MKKKLFVLLQYVLPQHAVSLLIYRLTRIKTPWFKNAFIRHFARFFRVNWDESITQDPNDFEHFNAFFTRALKPSARPIDDAEDTLVSPADGVLSEYGAMDHDTLIQAKGQHYTLNQLFAGDESLATRFSGGHFLTVYLSPRDYHRVHMPLGGRLDQTIYVPGKLYSVNLTTTHAIPGIFARNERVICVFECDKGWMAQVLVGAINVGSMETVWAGQITPPYGKQKQTINGDMTLNKGDEMGRFNMGSTVVTVFSPGLLKDFESASPYQAVNMGQAIGRLNA